MNLVSNHHRKQSKRNQEKNIKFRIRKWSQLLAKDSNEEYNLRKEVLRAFMKLINLHTTLRITSRDEGKTIQTWLEL